MLQLTKLKDTYGTELIEFVKNMKPICNKLLIALAFEQKINITRTIIKKTSTNDIILIIAYKVG